MTIRKLLTLTVCTALLGCSDDPEQTQQVPPTTGFGNRLSGLTAIIPEAGVTDLGIRKKGIGEKTASQNYCDRICSLFWHQYSGD